MGTIGPAVKGSQLAIIQEIEQAQSTGSVVNCSAFIFRNFLFYYRTANDLHESQKINFTDREVVGY